MQNRLLSPADVWRLAIVAAAAVLFFALQPLTPVRVVWPSFAVPYAMIVLIGATGLVYRRLGRDAGIASACFVTAQVLLFSNFAALDNYLGSALHRPLVDASLAAVDRAFGLDWMAYVVWIKSNAIVSAVLTLAYMSTTVQLAAAIVFLGITQRIARLDELTFAFMIGAAVCIGIWCVFPSFGALPLHYALGLPAPEFTLAMSEADARNLLAIHAGHVAPLRFDEMTGLIGSPSFHTVMALVTVWAMRGIRIAFPLAVAVNIPVLLAIPADGGHHFVDMASGLAVAVLAVAVANALLGARVALRQPELRVQAA